MKHLDNVEISGKYVLPIVEGGKGIAISNGYTAGAFAACDAVGTLSGVNPDKYDDNGNVIAPVYYGKTPKDRHQELINYSIEAGIEQAKIAYEKASGNGRIHINVLWEMGGTEEILHGILEKASHFIHGITCGGGMPYRLAEITAQYNIFSLPIVSSARAFSALWRRAYHKFSDWIGGVVYEDPWLAGGHNGISNAENPLQPQKPYERVLALRKLLTEVGLANITIIIAGGVWCLSEWQEFINNSELGNIAFQFGTRPLITKESPISDEIKKYLLKINKGDVLLHQFSPTGMYSSAVNNKFLLELQAQCNRQTEYNIDQTGEFMYPVMMQKQTIFCKACDKEKIEHWIAQGFSELIRTPDNTVMFISKERYKSIIKDQRDCVGCLSSCLFSGWSQKDHKIKADPRKFCIQKTLQNIAHNGDPENNLMFSGHSVYKFQTDPFYANGFIPSVKELIDRIKTGH